MLLCRGICLKKPFDAYSNPMRIERIKKIPWFNIIEKISIPVSCHRNDINQNSNKLRTFLSDNSIEIKKIIADVFPAADFNNYLNDGNNKSEACQKILSPLVKRTLSDKSRIVIDRQGGRKYYGEWLIDLFPNSSILIERETKDLSSYDLGESQIRFQVKGDDKYLETALASIFSKYLRELFMIAFNQYWSEQAQGIKKTAGYPQDGKRFIKDLDDLNLSYDKEILIRKK